VAFIRGQVLRVDNPSRLRSGAARPTIHVDLAEAPGQGVLDALRRRPGVVDVRADGNGLEVQVENVRDATPGVVRTLVLEDAQVLSVRESTATLESVYFDVMGVEPTRGVVP
jgi:hypothetical protein